MAARNGIMAALMAQKGYTGLKDPLQVRGISNYCPKPIHPEYMNRDLGKEFYTQGMHKFYPSCYGNHNLIDCGLDILKEHDIDAADIQEIIIGLQPMMLHSYGSTPFKKGDAQPAALFYQSYSVANLLLRKGVKIEHYTEEAVRDPEIIEMCSKVKHAPRRKDGKMEVIVKMKGGKNLPPSTNTLQMRVSGQTFKPGRLADKYWNNINFWKISQKNAELALDMIDNLEKVDNVNKLVKLLVA
jgi:2-methylcitrate dehydratase PrpD